MNDRVLFRVVTTTPSVATRLPLLKRCAAPHGKAPNRCLQPDGCGPGGKWASFVVSSNAHWFLELRGSARTYYSFLGRFMGYLLSIFCLIAVLVAAGFLYQWLGAHFDRWRFCSRGKMDRHRGRARIYLLEKGSGEATVLFESGIAATNLNWFHIQETVSQFAPRHRMIAADWDGAVHPKPLVPRATSPRNCTN